MEHKTHFKLHKVKKHWITIAISSLTLGIIASTGNIAYAEQSELPLTNQTIENSIVFEESAINTSNTFIDEKTTSQSESSLKHQQIILRQPILIQSTTTRKYRFLKIVPHHLQVKHLWKELLMFLKLQVLKHKKITQLQEATS